MSGVIHKISSLLELERMADSGFYTILTHSFPAGPVGMQQMHDELMSRGYQLMGSGPYYVKGCNPAYRVRAKDLRQWFNLHPGHRYYDNDRRWFMILCTW